MRASYVLPTRTPVLAVDYAQGLELALGGDGNVPPGAIAVLMAHAALETGQDRAKGTIGPSCFCFNFGNVKAGEAWEGSYTCITLNEYLVRDGKRVLVWFAPEGELTARPGPGSRIKAFVPFGVPPGHPQTRMRAFSTAADGIAAKIAFLRQPHFARAWAALMRGDAAAYVAEIHAQRYFTADFEPYQRAVVSLAKTFLPIAQKIAGTPLALPQAEAAHVDAILRQALSTPKMLGSLDLCSPEHVAAVQLDLHDTIDWRTRNP